MSNKKIYFYNFFTELRKWIPWLIIIGLCIFGYLKYKEFKQNQPNPITVTETIEIPGQDKIITRFKDRILTIEAKPETVYVDTNKIDLSKYFYERPWGIIELRKNSKRMEVTMFRLTGLKENEATFRKERYNLKYGETFYITPTQNPDNPFVLKERRDMLDLVVGGGWSANDKPYLTTGIYLKGIRIKNLDAKIGICSYTSFKNQDLRLEVLMTF